MVIMDSKVQYTNSALNFLQKDRYKNHIHKHTDCLIISKSKITTQRSSILYLKPKSWMILIFQNLIIYIKDNGYLKQLVSPFGHIEIFASHWLLLPDNKITLGEQAPHVTITSWVWGTMAQSMPWAELVLSPPQDGPGHAFIWTY